MLLDARQRATDFLDRLKLALIGHDPSVAPTLYPQWAGQGEPDPEGDWLNDPGSKDIEFANPVDPAHAEQLLTDLLGEGIGTLTAADLDGDW